MRTPVYDISIVEIGTNEGERNYINKWGKIGVLFGAGASSLGVLYHSVINGLGLALLLKGVIIGGILGGLTGGIYSAGIGGPT